MRFFFTNERTDVQGIKYVVLHFNMMSMYYTLFDTVFESSSAIKSSQNTTSAAHLPLLNKILKEEWSREYNGCEALIILIFTHFSHIVRGERHVGMGSASELIELVRYSH